MKFVSFLPQAGNSFLWARQRVSSYLQRHIIFYLIKARGSGPRITSLCNFHCLWNKVVAWPNPARANYP